MPPFRERYTLEARIAERIKATARRPGYVPAVLEPGTDTALDRLEREKFMLPRDLTGAQLLYIMRRRLTMKSSQALFLVCRRRMVCATDRVGDLYIRYKDPEDGFLYVTFTLEHAFGSMVWNRRSIITTSQDSEGRQTQVDGVHVEGDGSLDGILGAT